MRRLIRSGGAKPFFLPRYSPDLNPIEQVFAKQNTLLRRADPRTTKTSWRGINGLLERSTPQECADYLANAAMLQLNPVTLLGDPCFLDDGRLDRD
jgi:transposase